MAKTTTAAQPQAEEPNTVSGGQLVRGAAVGLPAFMQEDTAKYSGAGISDRQEDFLLPFMYIAQSNSPQVKRQIPDKYIPGLEAGDLFDTATRRFWKGDEGVLVVPLFYKKAEVEWIPRSGAGGESGGGSNYIATHDIDTPLAKQVRLGGPDNRFRLLPNGHQLVETAYHFVLCLDTLNPMVVGMSSTNLQASKTWNTLMKEVKIPVNGELLVAPCFSRMYRLRTVFRKNDSGDWFMLSVSDEGWVTDPAIYKLGRDFFAQASEKGVQLGRPPEADAAAANSAVDPGRDDSNVPI